MRQPSNLRFYFPLFFLGILCFTCLPTVAQRPTVPSSRSGMPGVGIGPSHTYSVSGKVMDAESHTQIDQVRVDLRSFTGGIVSTVFTSGAGDFHFDEIGAGSYEVVVQQQGYQSLTQQLDIQGPTYGILLELRPLPTASSMSPGSQKISARELSIPRKARESMEKGMALLYSKNDYSGSIKQFEHAIQEYPNYYEAYAQMGVADLHLKNTESAEQDLRKSVELSEDHYVDAYFWLATLLSNSERFAEAEPIARKGVEIDPNSWQANSELARALLGLHRPADAEPIAMAAAKLRPDNARMYLILANVHSQLQNDAALLDDLNNYLRLEPKGPISDQARKQQKELQQALGDAQKAPAGAASPNP
jgi:Tfp pilus assembly protein PilF